MSADAAHYDMQDAKTHLSHIIERVERGEEVIIDRAGVPVARAIPLVRRVNRTVSRSGPSPASMTPSTGCWWHKHPPRA